MRLESVKIGFKYFVDYILKGFQNFYVFFLNNIYMILLTSKI